MLKNAVLLGLLAVVLAVPFLLRPQEERGPAADDTLVIITPHFGTIRDEFTHGFREWYRARTGRRIDLDWRVIGGTSEILRYVRSEYTNQFRLHWERDLRREWSAEAQNGFANRRQKPAPEGDAAAQARAAFLASDVGIGVDVFFGGGSFDFISLASSGLFQPAGVAGHPALGPHFGDGPGQVPAEFGGEPFWDSVGLGLPGQPAGDLWYGTVLSTFGIIYNRDALERLALEAARAERPLGGWRDLADPRLFRQLALADPTKSGSINKAFELIAQQAMREHLEAVAARPDHPRGPAVAAYLAALAADPAAKAGPDAQTEIAAGWGEAMRLILRISANARYFTDASTKPSVDVSSGDCAAGMSIDFYGRTQQEILVARRPPGEQERFGFVAPEGGTTASVDPIAIFRGAPHRKQALLFVEYVLSPAGQALWNLRPGATAEVGGETVRGPRDDALRRPPIRREFYDPTLDPVRSDPGVNPYRDSDGVVYRRAWTGHLFSALRFIIRNAAIDVLDELHAAQVAIIAARREGRAADAAAAEAAMLDVAAIDYAQAVGPISAALGDKDPMVQINLARDLSSAFRAQYLRAARLARGGGQP